MERIAENQQMPYDIIFNRLLQLEENKLLKIRMSMSYNIPFNHNGIRFREEICYAPRRNFLGRKKFTIDGIFSELGGLRAYQRQ